MARKRDEMAKSEAGDRKHLSRDKDGRFVEEKSKTGSARQRVNDALERVLRQHRPALEYLRDK